MPEEAQGNSPVELVPPAAGAAPGNVAPPAQAAAPAPSLADGSPLPEEIKIFIMYKNGAALVGLQRPDCDIVPLKVKGTVAQVGYAIPNLIAAADARWKKSRRAPEYVAPATIQGKPAVAKAAPAAKTTAASTAPVAPAKPPEKKVDGVVQTGLGL